MSNQGSPQQDPRYGELVAQYGNAARVPVSDAVIEYAHAEEKRLHTGVQFVLGLLFPIAYGVLAGISLAMAEEYPSMFFLLAWLHPIVFIISVVYIRVKQKWRGFLAGVLTTVLGAPLGFGIVCAIVCASM